MSRARATALATLALVAMPGAASAHAIGMRYDLPLPLAHYLLGAGAAVALSFVVAAWFIRRPATTVPSLAIHLPATPLRLMLGIVRIAAVTCFTLLLLAGFLGPEGDWDINILPVTVWVVWWVGLAFVSALLGDLWAVLNPLAITARWTAAAWRRLRPDHPWRTRPLLPRLGAWPAVLLLCAFAWAELVWPSNAVPQCLACAILLYAAITWAGMARFGIATWLRHGDAFAILFGLFARLAPLTAEQRPDGSVRLVLRPWGAGLAEAPPASPSLGAFVILALAHVSFDGIAETPFWYDVAGGAMGLLYRSGAVHLLGFTNAGMLVKTLGLLATAILFLLAFRGITRVMAALEGRPPAAVAAAYVLTLVPIAVAYHLAHYFSYLLIQGQLVMPLLADPFGQGWNLFGWRGRPLDIGVVEARTVWVTAVVAIVTGHVVAVVLAHVAALAHDADRHRAIIGQAPMVVLMVGYTILSLWILSQPIVEA
jgi:hypothetical protein